MLVVAIVFTSSLFVLAWHLIQLGAARPRRHRGITPISHPDF
jgi:hypothetical protein